LNAEEAMKRFENGDAVGVYTTVLLMRTGGKNYISFDGEEWEEIESELIDKQI
jgi:hypothetical protein